MSGNLELRIRERAHRIWVREGQPQGRDVAHWHMAAAEIAAETAAPARKADAAAAKKPRAPKRAAAARAATPSKSRKATD
jgi:Protein of unknown function (DUF2934)